MKDLTSHGIVALIRDGNRYLLLKDCRELMKDHWSAPHGRCESNDRNEEECVIREVEEETSLKVRPVKKIWTTKADTKVKTVSFWVVDYIEGDVQLDASESSEFGWFELDEILKLKLYPGNKKLFTMIKEEEISL